MALDSRVTEKEIAPFIVEEIDARNMIRYKFGQSNKFILDRFKTKVNEELFHQKNIKLMFNKIFRTRIVIKTTFKADDATVIWKIKEDEKEIFAQEVKVNGTVTITYTHKPQHDEFKIKQYAISESEVDVETLIMIEIDHVLDRITADDLGTSVFYVERLILDPSDHISLGTLANCFENRTNQTKEIIFTKPMATRELLFLNGKPEVVIYFTKLKDKNM